MASENTDTFIEQIKKRMNKEIEQGKNVSLSQQELLSFYQFIIGDEGQPINTSWLSEQGNIKLIADIICHSERTVNEVLLLVLDDLISGQVQGKENLSFDEKMALIKSLNTVPHYLQTLLCFNQDKDNPDIWYPEISVVPYRNTDHLDDEVNLTIQVETLHNRRKLEALFSNEPKNAEQVEALKDKYSKRAHYSGGSRRLRWQKAHLEDRFTTEDEPLEKSSQDGKPTIQTRKKY